MCQTQQHGRRDVVMLVALLLAASLRQVEKFTGMVERVKLGIFSPEDQGRVLDQNGLKMNKWDFYVNNTLDQNIFHLL